VPETAQSGIGQRDVRATPMQMAMLTASIVNGGELVRPHVVPASATRRPSARGRRQRPRGTRAGTTAVPSRRAPPNSCADMMVDVGRGRHRRAPGSTASTVGGKTGTAQTGGDPTAWFVGFAEDQVAVAVVVPDSAGPDATGGASRRRSPAASCRPPSAGLSRRPSPTVVTAPGATPGAVRRGPLRW
jgi:penicillin-binding protein A